MRRPTIAWFRAARPAASPLDDTAALTAGLAASFRVDTYDEATAHDFVWIHARQPYDVCVYELANTPAHAFIRPYLFHYPGVLRLRSRALDRLRPLAPRPTKQTRLRDVEHLAEQAFSGADLVRAPVLASKLVAVSDELLSTQLAQAHPGAHIRHVPLGLGVENPAPRPPEAPVRFGALAGTGAHVLQRAAERARQAGTHVDLVAPGASDERVLDEADVIVALEWPPSSGEPPAAALAAMSRRKLAVVLETDGTARWPALDPQSWQPRGPIAVGPPLVISIDPRDEEHSLMLVLRRLTADAAVVARMAALGHTWWRRHATLALAVSAWEQMLGDARDVAPPTRVSAWPAHLTADGTEKERRLLADFRVSADVLD